MLNRTAHQKLSHQPVVQSTDLTRLLIALAACAPTVPSLSRLAITRYFRKAVADLSIR